MATLQKIFSDIDFAFTPTPTGDVALSYDVQSVSRSIRNLLLTNHFDRLFNPDLGSNITGKLFELSSIVTTTSLQIDIADTIKNYEPRALLKNVQVTANPDQNSYTAKITFYLQNASLPTTLTVILGRNR